MSPLERKWWFALPVMVLTTMCTLYLMDSAGVPNGMDKSAAQWIVHLMCFFCVWRALSLAGWLLVWAFSPTVAGSRPAFTKP